MRFAVFTHVIHQQQKSRYYAYSPYVREMNIWFKYVEEVVIVASDTLPPPMGEPQTGIFYQHSKIIFKSIPSFDMLRVRTAIKAVYKIPWIFFQILVSMQKTDHIHLRCPGNIGFIACIAQMFFPSKPKTAKYAGNWDPRAEQPLSYKLQKYILTNTFLTRNMTVLVYGNWLNQSKNILPFFTASFTEIEREIIIKELEVPYKFLFVGNLVPGKQPGVALQIVERLVNQNIQAELHVYGDGKMLSSLENQAENKNYIHLHGNQSLEILKNAYKEAHFLILPSKSEGWPKAVAEAMFFGCVPIATAVSCVPGMLGAPPVPEGETKNVILTKRGILIPDNIVVESGEKIVDSQDVVEETVEMIIELIQDKKEMRRMSMEAQEWSQQYTLEKFEAEIKKLLVPQKS